ncbi:hypothetical protein HDU87_008162 [Geranomyces variabilis]|uniref:Uncharacterized protein n=1 Tax=Geranomyces variabilis TaxID=109894 RepID=A0AAD5XMA8_9FUNG|nr:hypothetical protein HDU87_008162 [Geranomyces variabilis]
MIFIVFPKPFEFRKALRALHDEDRLIVHTTVHKGTHHFDVVCYNNGAVDKPKYHIFLSKVIDDSDVGFLLKFYKFLAAFKEHYKHYEFHQFRFAVFGTCGSCQPDWSGKKWPVGTAYYVKTAYKGDRGHIRDRVGEDGPMFSFISNDSKPLQASASDTAVKQHGFSICSTNSLMEAEHRLLHDGVNLYDMETYDFFKVVQDVGATLLGAIRVVSDYCGAGQKLNRLLCSFQEGLDILKSLVEEDAMGCAYHVDMTILLRYADFVKFVNDPGMLASMPNLLSRPNEDSKRKLTDLSDGKNNAHAFSAAMLEMLKEKILQAIRDGQNPETVDEVRAMENEIKSLVDLEIRVAGNKSGDVTIRKKYVGDLDKQIESKRREQRKLKEEEEAKNQKDRKAKEDEEDTQRKETHERLLNAIGARDGSVQHEQAQETVPDAQVSATNPVERSSSNGTGQDQEASQSSDKETEPEVRGWIVASESDMRLLVDNSIRGALRQAGVHIDWGGRERIEKVTEDDIAQRYIASITSVSKSLYALRSTPDQSETTTLWRLKDLRQKFVEPSKELPLVTGTLEMDYSPRVRRVLTDVDKIEREIMGYAKRLACTAGGASRLETLIRQV